MEVLNLKALHELLGIEASLRDFCEEMVRQAHFGKFRMWANLPERVYPALRNKKTGVMRQPPTDMMPDVVSLQRIDIGDLLTDFEEGTELTKMLVTIRVAEMGLRKTDGVNKRPVEMIRMHADEVFSMPATDIMLQEFRVLTTQLEDVKLALRNNIA